MKNITFMFLGSVEVGPVHGFHVLPQRAGVRVPLGAPRRLAHVRFLKKRKRFKNLRIFCKAPLRIFTATQKSFCFRVYNLDLFLLNECNTLLMHI